MTAAEDLVDLASIKAAIKALEAEAEIVQARLISTLDAKNRKTISVQLDEDGARVRGTVVKGSRVVLSEERLRQALDAKQWDKVTSRVLDKEKLEAAVIQKIVDEQVVASCSEVKDNKPFVNVTGKIAPKELGKVMFEGGQARVVDRHIRVGKRVRPARKVV